MLAARNNAFAYPDEEQQHPRIPVRHTEKRGNVTYIRQGEERLPEQKKKTTPAEEKAQAPQRHHKGLFSTLLVIIMIFGAFSFIIARYSALCEDENHITALKSEIAALEEKSNNLKLEIALNEDLEHVRQVASEKLKMGFPADNQIVYVNFDGNKMDNGDNAVALNGSERNINVLAEVLKALE